MMTALWGSCGRLLGCALSHQDGQRAGALIEYARVTELMAACSDLMPFLTAVECLACSLKDGIPSRNIYKAAADTWWDVGLTKQFAGLPSHATVPNVVNNAARIQRHLGGGVSIRYIHLQNLTTRGQQALANIVCAGLEREQWWQCEKTTGQYYAHGLEKHIDLATNKETKRRLYSLAGRPRARTYQRIDHRRTRFAGR